MSRMFIIIGLCATVAWTAPADTKKAVDVDLEWQEVELHHASDEPEGRTQGHRIVLDPLRDRMIVISNVETWALELSKNRRIHIADASPLLLAIPILDPIRQRLVATGGDKWATLDLAPRKEWQKLPLPGRRTGAAQLYLDPSNQQWLAVAPKSALRAMESWVNKMSENTWKRQEDHADLDGGSFTVTYDPAGNQFILIEGYGAKGPDSAGNVWVMDGRNCTWTHVDIESPLSPRDSFSTILDPAHGRILVVGGGTDQDFSGTAVWALRLDTMTWDVLGGAGLTPLEGPLLLVDADGRRLMIVGGSPDYEVLLETGVFNLDTEEGEKIESPPAIQFSALIVDPARRRVVAVGANTATLQGGAIDKGARGQSAGEIWELPLPPAKK